MKKDLLNSKKDGLLSLEDIVIESFVTGYVNSNPTLAGNMTGNAKMVENNTAGANRCMTINDNCPTNTCPPGPCNMVSDVAVTCKPNNTYYCTSEENTCPASVQGSCRCHVGDTKIQTCAGATCDKCTIVGEACANHGTEYTVCQCNVQDTNFQTCGGGTCQHNCTIAGEACVHQGTVHQSCLCYVDKTIVITCVQTCVVTCGHSGRNTCGGIHTCAPFTCCETCAPTCIAACNTLETLPQCMDHLIHTKNDDCPGITAKNNTWNPECDYTKYELYCKTYPPCGATDFHAGCPTKDLAMNCFHTLFPKDYCWDTTANTALPLCAYINTQPPYPHCGIMP